MTLNVWVGFDPREAVAYHVFCQSVIERTGEPVAFKPLALGMLPGYDETHRDGSNQFIYSRFLVPCLEDFQGWALFVDGDMLCRRDIAELFALRDSSKAVQVVQHDYRTRNPFKYLGTSMVSGNADYPRKNWSSVILWNCAHPANRVLTQRYVMERTGAHLHRFAWLKDSEIGALPVEWNHLVREQPARDAAIAHYTCGVPGIGAYSHDEFADEWLHTRGRMLACPC